MNANWKNALHTAGRHLIAGTRHLVRSAACRLSLALMLASLLFAGNTAYAATPGVTAPAQPADTSYTAYLVSPQNVRIGMLYEQCSASKAWVLVQLQPGIYLHSGERLTLLTTGGQFVLSYMAMYNGVVQSFQGASHSGCITPATTINLYTVSAGPGPYFYTLDGRTIWY